jgi:hypothetical protein
MEMKNYIIYDNGVEIGLADGQRFQLKLTQESGTIYYRLKINTISNVKHPGIFLGVAESYCFL